MPTKLFSGDLFVDFIGYKSSLTLRDHPIATRPKESIYLAVRIGEVNEKYLFLKMRTNDNYRNLTCL